MHKNVLAAGDAPSPASDPALPAGFWGRVRKGEEKGRGGKQGQHHRGCGDTTYPHFCGMYPEGGTTQFTLYTCRVLQATAGRRSYAIHIRL